MPRMRIVDDNVIEQFEILPNDQASFYVFLEWIVTGGYDGILFVKYQQEDSSLLPLVLIIPTMVIL